MNKTKKLIQEWIKKAENDLKNAKVLLNEGGTIDAVCFHSQQAVEKYLKAYLIHLDFEPKRVHSLVALTKQAESKDPALLNFIKELKTL